MATRAQYLILGHSSEKPIPYEQRPKVPEGTTILILAECDLTTRTPDVEKAIELAGQTPLDFSKFRIYEEGSPYPPLELQLLDFQVETTKKKTYAPVLRSGVYAGPLNLPEFKSYEDFTSGRWQLNEKTGTSTYSGYGMRLIIPDSRKRFITYKKSVLVDAENPEKDMIEFQFSDAIYPSKSQLADILKSSPTIFDIAQKLIISLEDLIEKLGPGIYIVPTCRTVNVSAGKEEQDLFDYIEAEIDPELESHLSLRANVNRLKYRKQKLNFLNSLKNHPKLQEEPWKQTLNTVRNRLRKIVGHIENTRSKSALRQRGVKTRKKSSRK